MTAALIATGVVLLVVSVYCWGALMALFEALADMIADDDGTWE